MSKQYPDVQSRSTDDMAVSQSIQLQLSSVSSFEETTKRVIRTPDQKLRVFISSTLQELAEERQAAKAAITALRLSPVLFELSARPHPAQELYLAYLEQSPILSASTSSVTAGWLLVKVFQD
jgi:Domain of unknown function (DUF4062)